MYLCNPTNKVKGKKKKKVRPKILSWYVSTFHCYFHRSINHRYLDTHDETHSCSQVSFDPWHEAIVNSSFTRCLSQNAFIRAWRMLFCRSPSHISMVKQRTSTERRYVSSEKVSLNRHSLQWSRYNNSKLTARLKIVLTQDSTWVGPATDKDTWYCFPSDQLLSVSCASTSSMADCWNRTGRNKENAYGVDALYVSPNYRTRICRYQWSV